MTTSPSALPRVSPGLVKATTEALAVFAEHWPRAVRIAGAMYRNNESRDALILQWARSLTGITFDAIPEAARRWLADPNHAMANGRTVIPTIPNFARYARQIDRQYFRVGHSTAPLPNGMPGTASTLAKGAKEILGSLRRVAEVTDELLKFCPDDLAARQRVRANRFSTEKNGPFPQERHYWEAVEIVRLRHADAIERERQHAQEREAAAC